MEHIEPDASVEGAVASMKEEATKAAMEIQSEQIKGLQSAQSSDGHFQWLKDAAQVIIITTKKDIHFACVPVVPIFLGQAMYKELVV